MPMSRRQSLDRPGILSPPGPFLTPSPSPSISASPRLQPSPSLSPFSQEVFLVSGNTITNTAQEQERKAATPGRRQSIQFSGSPNAGTVVFQPSPSQSPAASTTVIGINATGNEFNTTLVGSNNIQLNKKGTNKRQYHISNSSASSTTASQYGQSQTINICNSFATANVACSPKGQAKKASILPQLQGNNNHHHTNTNAAINHPHQQLITNSPLTADIPIASPSGGCIKSHTPQSQMLQQFPVVSGATGAASQIYHLIQSPQLISTAQAAVQQHQNQQHQQNVIAQHHPQQQQQQRSQVLGTVSVQTTNNSTNISSNNNNTTNKSSKIPQQILPKPQHQQIGEQQKGKTFTMQLSQISQSSHPPQTHSGGGNAQTNIGQQQQNAQQQQQIILPTGTGHHINTQPLLLNQMPLLVQQNTPQGVQLILRPPTPQMATPSLVIHNARPQQLQQQQPQQLLRILNTNGAMQLTTTPTFIVSSQANLIHGQTANLQTIKANSQTPAITQLSGLHAALSAASGGPRSQQFTTATINSHILGQSVAAQLQNIQLANGNHLAQIQMQNGLGAGQILSQLPAQFQQSIASFNSNSINLNQLNSTNIQQLAVAAAAGATFQSPPPTELQATVLPGGQNFQFSTTSQQQQTQHISITSPQPQLMSSVTPEPVKHSTLGLQQQPKEQKQQGLANSAINSTNATTQEIKNGVQIAQGQIFNRTADEMQRKHLPNTLAEIKVRKTKPRKKKQQLTVPAVLQSAELFPPGANDTNDMSTMNKTQVTSTVSNTTSIVPKSVPVTTCVSQTPFPTTTSATAGNQKHFVDSIAVTSAGAEMTPDTNIFANRNYPVPTPSPPVSRTLTSTGKLDLGNVMKLCGIMEDDDDDYMNMEIDQPLTLETSPRPQSSMSQLPNTSNCNDKDIMISIPSQQSDIPYTYTISAENTVKTGATASCGLSTSALSTSLEMNAESTITSIDGHNISIKIDQNDSATSPYSISLPRLPSTEEIHQKYKQQQQQLSDSVVSNVFQKQHQPESRYNLDKMITKTQRTATPNSISTSTESASSSVAPQGSDIHNQILSGPKTISSASTKPNAPSIVFPEQRGISITSFVNDIQNQLIGVTPNIQQSPSLVSCVMQQQQQVCVQQQRDQQLLHQQQRQQQIEKQVDQHIHQQQQQQQQQNQLILHQRQQFVIQHQTRQSQQQPKDQQSVSLATINQPTVTIGVAQVTNQQIATTVATTMTTATIKPRRKPAVRRNGKKAEVITGRIPQISSSVQSVTSPSSVVLSTATTQVPSQIGNIQISQVDVTKPLNSNLPPVSNVVENKIQIMPILDNAGIKIGSHTMTVPNSSTAAQHQQPQTQIVYQNLQQQQQQELAAKFTNDSRQMQSTVFPQSSQQKQLSQQQNSMSTHITEVPSLTSENVSISINSSAAISSLIPQLTGSLSLAVSEECERLILRHDPNKPHDQQSQLILQALLKGALPNLTIVNEKLESKDKQQQQQIQLQPQGNNSKAIAILGKGHQPQQVQLQINEAGEQQPLIMVQHQQQAQQQQQQIQPAQPLQQQHTDVNPKKIVLEAKSQNKNCISEQQLYHVQQKYQQKLPQQQLSQNQLQTMQQQQLSIANNQQNDQKFVALPKVDANQQLFCLNTLTNQITQINQGQTTASLGSMERLLIAPAGINAQQLAQCLSQGQIHFNNTTHISQQQSQQQPQQNQSSTINANSVRVQQQQIVHPQQHQPIQPLGQHHHQLQPQPQQPKQVANVAPIIDQSKAKLDPKPKRKPVRKPKITTVNTTTTNTLKNAVVKPMPKLHLTQKPNTNPVQVVQPNVVSKTNVGATTSTATTSPIHPFQSGTLTGTKLVGVTAPMQQQQQIQTQEMQSAQVPQQQVGQTQQLTQQHQQRHRNIVNANNSSNSNINVNTTNLYNGKSNAPNLNQSNNSGVFSSNSNNILNASEGSQNAHSLNVNNINNLNISNTTGGGPPLLTSISNNSVSSTSDVKSQDQQKQQQQQQQQQQIILHMKPLQQQQNQSQMQQQSITRVQTIQLTSQQQHVLKAVQMNIQELSAKIQNKGLLVTLNIPLDTDTSNSIFNKPLPSLNNLQNMTDAEIYTCLQRLFVEQKRILASGKLIRTPDGFIPTTPNGGFTFLQQPRMVVGIQQHQQLPMAKDFEPKSAAESITSMLSTSSVNSEMSQQTLSASIAQPNNHNSVVSDLSRPPDSVASSVINDIPLQQQQENAHDSHRIHIYPIQHRMTDKQKQDEHKQGEMHIQHQHNQKTLEAKVKETVAKIKQIATAQQQSQTINSSNNSVHQKQNPASHVQVNVTKLDQCSVDGGGSTDPTSHSVIRSLSSQQQQHHFLTAQQQSHLLQMPSSSSAVVASTSMPISVQVPMSTLSTVSTTSSMGTSVVMSASNTTTAVSCATTAVYESPKPKIARFSLFIRQLEVDQHSCLDPDCIHPFQSKEEAVKRLVRYHCMNENDEEIPHIEEEEFENTALDFQEKFRTISEKFQEILLKESTLFYRTSELCQINQLMVNDLQTDLQYMRNEMKNQMQQKTPLSSSHQTDNSIATSKNCSTDNFKPIKRYLDAQSNDFYRTTPILQTKPAPISPWDFANSNSGSYAAALQIKDEVKSEQLDMDFDNFQKTDEQRQLNNINKNEEKNELIFSNDLKVGFYDNKLQSTHRSHQLYNGVHKDYSDVENSSSSATSVRNPFLKKEYDNFDIESEITPTFIMKKRMVMCENVLEPCNKNDKQDNCLTTDEDSYSHHSNSPFSVQHVAKVHDGTASVTNFASLKGIKLQETCDEWISIQKELNLISGKKIDEVMQTQLTNAVSAVPAKNAAKIPITDIFDNTPYSNHLPELFSNGNITGKMDDHQQGALSNQHHSVHHHLSEFFNDELEQQKTVHTRLGEMFNDSKEDVVESISDTHDMVESRLGKLFSASHSPATDSGSGVLPTTNIHQLLPGISPDTKRTLNMTSTSISSPYMSRSQQQFLQQERKQTQSLQNETVRNTFIGEATTATTPSHQSNQIFNSTSRWIQTMESQFPEFLETTIVKSTEEQVKSDLRKRHWNTLGDEEIDIRGDDGIHQNSSKKLCFSSENPSTLSSSLTENANHLQPHQQDQHQDKHIHNNNQQQHQQEHQADPISSDLLTLQNASSSYDAITHQLMKQVNIQQQQVHAQDGADDGSGEFRQILNIQTQQQHQLQHHMHNYNQQFQNQIIQHMQIGNNTEAGILDHHMAIVGGGDNHNLSTCSSGGSMSSNFDDDISRHVQNAIDSILNLQNNESDSLPFSLDHSMGSFLGDNILVDQQQQHSHQHNYNDQITNSCTLITVGDSSIGKQCLDCLGESLATDVNGTSVLTASVGKNNKIIKDSLSQSVISDSNETVVGASSNSTSDSTVGGVHTNFSCVTGVTDDDVKSINTS